MPRPKLFEDTETTITVAEMSDGDFLVSFPTQRGIRGYRVNSGVTELRDDHTWGVRPGHRQRLIPTEARHFRTLTGVGLSLPSDCTVVIRRRLTTV